MDFEMICKMISKSEVVFKTVSGTTFKMISTRDFQNDFQSNSEIDFRNRFQNNFQNYVHNDLHNDFHAVIQE